MLRGAYTQDDYKDAILPIAEDELQSLGQGSTFTELSLDKLKELKVLNPPLTEQKAIAAFLDKECGRIDTLIGKVADSIRLLGEYRTALVTAAVTGKIDVRT